MKRKKRKNKNYKFTEKKRSVRGICACVGAGISILMFFVMIGNAIGQAGNGGAYLGGLGVIALFIGVASFIEAVQAVQEKNTFKTIPYLGVGLSGVVTVAWIILYLLGILL